MFNWFRNIKRDWVEAYKAARRGDVRVAPGHRGRVYARPNEPVTKSAMVAAKAAPRGGIVAMKVYRADEDKTYSIVPKTGEVLEVFEGDTTYHHPGEDD